MIKDGYSADTSSLAPVSSVQFSTKYLETKGQLIAIVGNSGSGKSMLERDLAGHIPDSVQFSWGDLYRVFTLQIVEHVRQIDPELVKTRQAFTAYLSEHRREVDQYARNFSRQLVRKINQRPDGTRYVTYEHVTDEGPPVDLYALINLKANRDMANNIAISAVTEVLNQSGFMGEFRIRELQDLLESGYSVLVDCRYRALPSIRAMNVPSIELYLEVTPEQAGEGELNRWLRDGHELKNLYLRDILKTSDAPDQVLLSEEVMRRDLIAQYGRLYSERDKIDGYTPEIFRQYHTSVPLRSAFGYFPLSGYASYDARTKEVLDRTSHFLKGIELQRLVSFIIDYDGDDVEVLRQKLRETIPRLISEFGENGFPDTFKFEHVVEVVVYYNRLLHGRFEYFTQQYDLGYDQPLPSDVRAQYIERLRRIHERLYTLTTPYERWLLTWEVLFHDLGATMKGSNGQNHGFLGAVHFPGKMRLLGIRFLEDNTFIPDIIRKHTIVGDVNLGFGDPTVFLHDSPQQNICLLVQNIVDLAGYRNPNPSYNQLVRGPNKLRPSSLAGYCDIMEHPEKYMDAKIRLRKLLTPRKEFFTNPGGDSPWFDRFVQKYPAVVEEFNLYGTVSFSNVTRVLRDHYKEETDEQDEMLAKILKLYYHMKSNAPASVGSFITAEPWDAALEVILQLTATLEQVRLDDPKEVYFAAVERAGFQIITREELPGGIFGSVLLLRTGPAPSLPVPAETAPFRKSG